MNDILSALPDSWKTAVILFMVGLVAGAGSSVWRVDKFTGTQGDILAKRIAQLEERQPETYPPPDWQIWRQTVTGELDAIRTDDRHTREMLTEMKTEYNNHTSESIEWKMRIKSNEQSIENLWKWFNSRVVTQ